MKKKTKNRIVTVTALLVVALGLVWLFSSGGGGSEVEAKIISRNGLHWHATLKILIDGQVVQIPSNIGLGTVHNPIHTHEDDEVIHLEFSGLVTDKNLTLGNFFDVWNEEFSSQCILDKCAGSETGKTLIMTVNGTSNTEFENYMLKDGDEIVIKYE
ncbi:MAG: hypothetical protein AAB787_01495 [Patescibacteria group bacterium]